MILLKEGQKEWLTKFEQERYRELFGLTDNIELRGEEDIVLQREFRIDFSLQKKDETIPTEGIFNYFKKHNILEFKSLNDPLDIVLLTKYLGQLFWWLYIKRKDAKEGKVYEISDEDVTLTIITVREPREVIKELQHLLGNRLTVRYHGHYLWHVMGIEVHLAVINQLPVTHEHYAWLSFAEGVKYQEYQENLVQDIQQDEEFDVYLELLQELEEEGKERMANEVLTRIMMNMPTEKRLAIWNNFADDLPEFIQRLPNEKRQEIMQQICKGFSSEKRREVLKSFSITELREILRELSEENP